MNDLEFENIKLILDQLRDAVDADELLLTNLEDEYSVIIVESSTNEELEIEINPNDYAEELDVYGLINKFNMGQYIEVLIKYDRKFAMTLALNLIKQLADTAKK